MRRSSAILLTMLVGLLVLLGPKALPAASATAPSMQDTIIRRAGNTSTEAQSEKSKTPGLERVAYALAIVIALILLLRWCGRRLMAGPTTAGSGQVVQVLSRSILAPKQQVLVLQIGRRIVVVGDTGQQMTPLCEIADPEEVAALVAQMHSERTESSTNFGNLFRRAIRRYDGDVDAQATPVGNEPEDETPASDPALSAARQEISGLAEKIRVMSGEFRRT